MHVYPIMSVKAKLCARAEAAVFTEDKYVFRMGASYRSSQRRLGELLLNKESLL